MDLVFFALEIVKIDPNLAGGLDRAPIGNSAQRQWLQGVAVLLEAGARPNVSGWSWNGTPLIRSLWDGLATDTSHYLLLYGADTRICDSDGFTAWCTMMNTVYDPFRTEWCGDFSFVHFEGSISHLLHHGSDPFEVFVSLYENIFTHRSQHTWFDDVGNVRASDIARFWSYGRIQEEYNFEEGPVSKILRQYLEEAEHTRICAWTFHWDNCGNISRSLGTVSQNDTTISNTSPFIYNEKLQQCVAEHPLDVLSYGGDSQSEDSASSIAEPICSDYISPKFYRNATRFYHHISNEQGRKQLSRFPMVRALCDALNHAGYRAEMDDDGDIWYDCDDGDRYFDALEDPVDESDETWFPRMCPICQDFEGYGLGHVLKTAERAKEQYYEYKEKVQKSKRCFK